jgi:hypothetical protein
MRLKLCKSISRKKSVYLEESLPRRTFPSPRVALFEKWNACSGRRKLKKRGL